MGGLRSGMGYGHKTMKISKVNGKFVKISAAFLKESHPHDIHITKKAQTTVRMNKRRRLPRKQSQE